MVIFCEASVSIWICVAPRRSLCRVPALIRFLCWAPALSVSVLGAVCVGFRRSPALLCVGPRRSVSRPATLSLSVLDLGGLCVGPRRSPALSLSGPGALCAAARSSVVVPPMRSSTHGVRERAPAPLRVPPPPLIWFCGPPACHPAGPGPQLRSAPPIQPDAFPFSRREPQNLAVWGMKWAKVARVVCPPVLRGALVRVH